MELGPEGQGDLLRPVPGRHEHRALVREQAAARPGGRQGSPRRRRPGAPAPAGRRAWSAEGRSSGATAVTPSPSAAARRQCAGLDREDVRARSLQHQRRQRADRAEPEHHDRLAQVGSGVERDLQRRLDEREQRRLPRRDRADRDQVARRGHEGVLVGLEGEDDRAFVELAPALLDDVRRSCTRTGTGNVNVPPSAPIVSSTGSAGSSSPRYASISVPPLIPEKMVRTRDLARPRRGAAVPSSRSPIEDRRTRELVTSCDPVCPRRAGVAQPPHDDRRGRPRPAPDPLRGVRRPRLRATLRPRLRGDGARARSATARTCSSGCTPSASPAMRWGRCAATAASSCDIALRTIAAEQRGVLVYATGHEGRGIGLVNKLRAYVAQDGGADTVDANLALGLPVDSRDYTESAEVLAALGVRTIRLMTNNPRKVSGLRAADGVHVNAVVPLATAPHHRNLAYLTTKAQRLDHTLPTGLTRTGRSAPERRRSTRWRCSARSGPAPSGRSSCSSTRSPSTGGSPRRPGTPSGSAVSPSASSRTRCARHATPCWSASAPSSPTIPSSPCAWCQGPRRCASCSTPACVSLSTPRSSAAMPRRP